MDFAQLIKQHAEHIKEVAHLCTTEETTKQALILPMLNILGYSPFNPNQVRAEYKADFLGAKASEKVDYALFNDSEIPVMFIEAKGYNINLRNHVGQLARYFNSTPDVSVGILTNGRHWLFFTDLNHRNIMDAEPFLEIDLTKKLSSSDIEQLQKFQRQSFDPDGLRNIAVNNAYISSLKDAVRNSLLELDTEFIRFFATRAGISRQLNERFLKTLQPIVRLAFEEAITEFISDGINSNQQDNQNRQADQVSASNPNIVTTWNERKFLEILQKITQMPEELIAIDSEEDYTIYLKSKQDKWLCKYFDNQKPAYLKLPIELNSEDVANINLCGLDVVDNEKIILESPEDVLRISFIIRSIYNML